MRLLYLVLVILFCLCPSLGTSADTGGSMGGGSWSSSSGGGSYSSGGGGYSSGGGGYSSGGGGYSSGGNSYSYSGGDGCSSSSSSSSSSQRPSPESGNDGGAAVAIVLFAVLGLITLCVLVAAIAAVGKTPPYMTSNVAPDDVDVSVLRIAVDGRARKFVQTELARIAASANTSSADGRREMLREVALMLRRLRDAWVYGGAVNLAMRHIDDAKRIFDKYVDDARSRFREETIRNAQGTITRRDASEYQPRSDEGAGLILVSIVIAAWRELFTVKHIGHGDELRAALEAASQLSPYSLVAIEVIWQPSEDSDRLSSIELEAKYPSPELVPITGALAGKVFCGYCTAPYPAELVTCPHCGAPARGRAA